MRVYNLGVSATWWPLYPLRYFMGIYRHSPTRQVICLTKWFHSHLN